MPSVKKPRNIYLAKSLDELRKKALLSDAVPLSAYSTNNLSTTASKLYVEALKLLNLDEEKAYILLFRFLNTVEQIRKRPGGKTDKVFDSKKQIEALVSFERLTESLKERYKVKIEEDHVEDLSHYLKGHNGDTPMLAVQADKKKIIELIPSPDSPVKITNGTQKPSAEPKDENTIGVIELYEMMQDRTTTVAIFDCRPAEEFEDSHINNPSCVNIPAEILAPGTTAAALGAKLRNEAKSLWNKRSLVDFVVLMDLDSSYKNMIPHGPLNSLNLAISKWDTNNVLKRNPVVLENGFENWVIHYPTTVTKVPPSTPALSMNSIDFQNSLPYIDTDYPDLDSIMGDPEFELMNVGFHEKSPSKASTLSTQYSMEVQKEAFLLEKALTGGHLPNSLKPNLTSTPQVPKFDRKTKPKVLGVAKPKEAWPEQDNENSTRDDSPEEEEEEGRVQKWQADADGQQNLRQEQAFEALRQRRETEANQAMLEIVQQQEEKLLLQLQALEEDKRVLHEKWKYSEEEKEVLKKKLQMEAEEKQQREDLAEKERKKQQLDKEVNRLRQERKRQEKLEQQNEELRLALERQPLDEKKKEDGTAAASSKSGGGPPAVTQQDPVPVIRPSTAPQPPSAKSVSGQPDLGGVLASQQKPQSHSAAVYTSRLKDEPGGLSPNRSNLSRSHSSPNIAQLLAEEDQRDHTVLSVPTGDKAFKPTKLGKDCSPSINRALKPADTNAARMRNFSPVFSSQPNTQTGLKNLGNTCFMNSVLQCLSHTQILARYLISGAYTNDIRSSAEGNRAEVIHELASVFQNLWQTYRSISPHEFKNTVSRHMSVCEGYDQQDAHEFLVVLMEKLHTESNKGTTNKGSKPPDLDKMSSTEEALNHFWVWHLKIHNSYIVRTFEGVLQSRLTCTACNHRAYTYEVFSCLSLPIPSHSKCSLKDCIQSLLRAEMMRGEAAWKCPNCKRKQDAEKKMGLCRLPPILIIHLKRFSYEGLWRRKLVTHVDFPLNDLDMEPHLIVPTKRSRYNLYGVVNHYGTLEGGHYTAFCKSEKWFNFDDHDVQPMNANSVKTSAAYILFYASVDS